MNTDKPEKINTSISEVLDPDDSLDDLLLTLSSLHISSSTESTNTDDEEPKSEVENNSEKKDKEEDEEFVDQEDYLSDINSVASENHSSISSLYSTADSEISSIEQESKEKILEKSTSIESSVDDEIISFKEPSSKVAEKTVDNTQGDTNITSKIDKAKKISIEENENKNVKMENKDQKLGSQKVV